MHGLLRGLFGLAGLLALMITGCGGETARLDCLGLLTLESLDHQLSDLLPLALAASISSVIPWRIHEQRRRRQEGRK